MEVTIDREAVEREVVQAILASSLGEKIEEAVNAALKPRFSGQGSVLDQAVASAVQEQVRIRLRELVRDPGPVHDQIEATLRAALTPEALDKITARFVHDLGLIQEGDLA